MQDAIQSGRLLVGSRLQSVREAIAQRGVSLATIVAAYRTLEERGLIAARAKSGYFVISKGPLKATSGGNTVPAREVPPDAQLRSAECADLSLFPQQRLHRLTASIVRRHPGLSTNYRFGAGITQLRREIARRSADLGSFIRPDDLIITNGATEGLLLALRAVAAPGDSVAVESPAHPLFLALLEGLHLKIVEIPVLSTQNCSPAAIDNIFAVAPPIRACLLTPNFHHPTGALMSVTTKRALVALAERLKFAIIEDDIYGDLQHAGPRPPPIKAFDTSGAVIYVTSYSKTIAPGLRVGWIASGRWQSHIANLKQNFSSPTAELPQLILYEFLNRGSHLPHLRLLRQSLRDTSSRVQATLTRLLAKTCAWSDPKGGYFLWLRFPEQCDAARLVKDIRAGSQSFRAGQAFSVDDAYSNYARINTSLVSESAIEELATQVNRAVK